MKKYYEQEPWGSLTVDGSLTHPRLLPSLPNETHLENLLLYEVHQGAAKPQITPVKGSGETRCRHPCCGLIPYNACFPVLLQTLQPENALRNCQNQTLLWSQARGYRTQGCPAVRILISPMETTNVFVEASRYISSIRPFEKHVHRRIIMHMWRRTKGPEASGRLLLRAVSSGAAVKQKTTCCEAKSLKARSAGAHTNTASPSSSSSSSSLSSKSAAAFSASRCTSARPDSSAT